MNTAQLQGLRNLHNSTVTIAKTDAGYEVRKGGKLQSICSSMASALEVASVVK